jgi:hypothetical protein
MFYTTLGLMKVWLLSILILILLKCMDISSNIWPNSQNVYLFTATSKLPVITAFDYFCGIFKLSCNKIIAPLWVQIPLRRGALDTTLCDKVCQWLVAGRWVSLGTPVSSTNKTDRHYIVIEAVQNLMCKHHPALFEMSDMSKLCRIQSWVRVMVFNDFH